MTTVVTELVERTKQLTIAEQCELLQAVKELVATEVNPSAAPVPSYDRWLAASGSMHSDYSNVSERVDEHLADIDADHHGA